VKRAQPGANEKTWLDSRARGEPEIGLVFADSIGRRKSNFIRREFKPLKRAGLPDLRFTHFDTALQRGRSWGLRRQVWQCSAAQTRIGPAVPEKPIRAWLSNGRADRI